MFIELIVNVCGTWLAGRVCREATLNRAELYWASFTSHQRCEGKTTLRQFQVPSAGTVVGSSRFELILLLLITAAIIYWELAMCQAFC